MKPVVLFGESLIGLNGSQHRPIDRGSQLELTFAGAEVNVAIGLARLGHPVRWVSMLGDDHFGRVILRGLRGEGVDTTYVQSSSSGPTALMVKTPRPGAEPEVIYYRSGSAMSQTSSATFDQKCYSDASVLFLSGITMALSDGCLDLVNSLVERASRLQIPIWFDPNHRRKLWTDEIARRAILPLLPNIKVFLAGLPEGEMLTGKATPAEIGHVLLDHGVCTAVIKDGANGAWLFERDSTLHMAGFNVPTVVDPIGAGDAFAAGLLSGYLDGLSWPDSMRRGNALGAICCQTKGDWEGSPSRAQLENYLSNGSEALR